LACEVEEGAPMTPGGSRAVLTGLACDDAGVAWEAGDACKVPCRNSASHFNMYFLVL